MLSTPKMLIKYGFVKSEYKKLCEKYIETSSDYIFDSLSESDAEKYADQETEELTKEHYDKTAYPTPGVKYYFGYQNINFGVEYVYYWILARMKRNEDFSHFDKITDTYAAASSSSHFGMMQTRLSAQQNQASQYLKGISDMVKGLFQIVRELRILDERLQYYNDTYEENESKVSSEIVLKGLWIDLVEGGPKNPASVYGMAHEVGFTILPDIFFRIQVKDTKDIDRVVDATKFNEKVKEVLRRKLRQYYEWKKRTYAELKTRRSFEIKYLRQHYDTIKLYISWIKPYLKNVAMLQPKESINDTAFLINSFEGAVAEIEVIARKKASGSKYWSIIVANFFYIVRPYLDYHSQEYQNKGPAHVGRVQLNLRAYAWTEEELERYKKYKEEETLFILGSIDASIREALDSLGDELKQYLIQGGEQFEEKKKAEKKKRNSLKMLTGPLEPFLSVFKGFAEIFQAFGISGFSLKGKGKKEDPYLKKKDKKEALDEAKGGAFMAYHYYKKTHGLTAW